jgi:hypothetical protein
VILTKPILPFTLRNHAWNTTGQVTETGETFVIMCDLLKPFAHIFLLLVILPSRVLALEFSSLGLNIYFDFHWLHHVEQVP